MPGLPKPLQRIMKLTTIFILAATLQVSAKGYSQKVTLSVKDVPIENVFKEIEKQTGYYFAYTRELIQSIGPVSLDVKDATLKDVLDQCIKGQPLSYTITAKVISVKFDAAKIDLTKVLPAPPIDVKGKIVNENGEPVEGATVLVKGNKTKGTSSDSNGYFELKGVDENATLVITGVNIETREIKINSKTELVITTKTVEKPLEETIIKGYYTTSKRFNTGSVDKLSQSDINKQPVSNPLATLQGRIPGLFITQGNGLPGSSFSVLIRGRNSIQQGTEPLFIIDGVPFNTDRQTQRSQIAANNPFNLINPLDIESIEVLKDAEATAIYGSRGANGVILITTKKGNAGVPKLELNISTGFGRAQSLADFMTTEQYIKMRREALQNDGIMPSNANAPDLLLWDTTRYTNFKSLLTGGTARTNKVNIKLSGGSRQTLFTFSTAYYDESTVFPGSWGEKKLTFNLNINHTSEDKKLTTQFSSSYSTDKSSLGQGDPTNFISLPPNTPELYDSIGRLNWRKNNAFFNNPMALLLKTYENRSEWLNGNFIVGYKFLPSLTARINAGYNIQRLKETSLTPIAAQDPASNPKGSSSFGDSYISNWIIEPQLEYNTSFHKKGNITLQLGNSYQSKSTNSTITDASGYINDELIHSTVGATSITTAINSSQYKYSGFFARLSVNWQKRYLLNLTGRRDGSSRFGLNKRFSNFGAAAFGWIFSEEAFMKKGPLGLSYGKLRVSYGSVGNDQIGDYMYLDTWSGTSFPYQGTPGIRPTRLQNDNYHWEHKSNLELALETGFFQDRLLFNVNYFRSRSNDQLINYLLPGQTGFGSILQNFPAVVQNVGTEISINYKIIQQKYFSWSCTFNLTFQKNKLLSFPGIEKTSYASSYMVGSPLALFRGYSYNGINSTTGNYQFNDLNQDGVVNTLDQYFVGTRDPKYYGGWQHEFNYKGFQLTFFFNFVKQKGLDVLAGNFAGTRTNMPVELLNRWQKAGDNAIYQRYSTGSALAFASQVRSSDVALVDASYIKLRNATISYLLPKTICQRLHIKGVQFFVQGQNLLTLTRYKGSDPEVQSLTTLPPLRIINTGITITF